MQRDSACCHSVRGQQQHVTYFHLSYLLGRKGATFSWQRHPRRLTFAYKSQVWGSEKNSACRSARSRFCLSVTKL